MMAALPAPELDVALIVVAPAIVRLIPTAEAILVHILRPAVGANATIVAVIVVVLVVMLRSCVSIPPFIICLMLLGGIVFAAPVPVRLIGGQSLRAGESQADCESGDVWCDFHRRTFHLAYRPIHNVIAATGIP
jgi:hypothetical protein